MNPTTTQNGDDGLAALDTINDYPDGVRHVGLRDPDADNPGEAYILMDVTTVWAYNQR